MEANAEVAKEHGYTGIPNGDAGLLDSDKAYEQMKKEEEAEEAKQEAKEEKLQDEYFGISDRLADEDLSGQEYEALEKRQDEILDEVEPID